MASVGWKQLVATLMQSQTVSINFGRGIDTKTDQKLVVSTKPVELQNAVFTQGGQLRKRNGYDAMTMNIVGGGTISSPTMVSSYRNELLLAASGSNGQRLFSYSPSLSAWADRGKYLSVAVSKQNVASIDQSGANASGGIPSGGFQNSTCAVLNNIAVFAYSVVDPNPQVYITVIDHQTGMQLASNMAISGAKGLAKVVVLAGEAFAMTYKDNSGYLQLVVISVTEAGGVSVGSPNQIAAPSLGVVTYDIIGTPGGAVAAYNGATGISTHELNLQLINSSGAASGSAVSISSPGDAIPISITTDASENVWIYWADATSSSETLYYAVYSSSLSVVLAKTSIASSLSQVTQITAYNSSGSQQTVYYSTYFFTPGGSPVPSIPTINTAVCPIAGSPGSSAAWLNQADIYGKISSSNSTHYMAVVFTSSLFPTGFLVDIADASAVAKFLPTSAEGINASGSANVERTAGFINNLIPISSTKLFLAAGYIPNGGLSVGAITSGTGTASFYQGATMATCAIAFDFDNIDAYQAINQQDTLLLNGGLVCQYDGSSVTELGFSNDPEISSVTTATTGGQLGSGQWIYYVVYEWLDANGNLHQSAPSIGYYVSFNSGTTNYATINARTLSITQKSNVNVVFYRTQSDGIIAYRIASVPNDPAATTVQYVDQTYTDTDIAKNQTLYTQGGAILENIAPPPAMIMWQNNSRAWLIDSENPETNIEYTKTGASGYGVSFSTGQLELVVDSEYGAMTGASRMDEKTVVFKENGVFYFYGDGASDAGTGSTISNILFIPSAVGCENSKSVTLYPNGILFKSPKGIYLVSRAVQVSYFGEEAESYNSQNVLSAQIMEGTTQIRFLTDSSGGSSLVYDYYYNQWGTFTNHTGVSSTIWNGSYVYITDSQNSNASQILIEDDSSYLDVSAPFAVLIQTAWIKANTIQNFQRVWEFELLGDYSCSATDTAYGVQMSFAYDFVPSFVPASVIPFSPTSGAETVFQERFFPSQQKCNAIQIQIAELPTGASGEYIDFSDLDMEIAVKRGLNKLSPFKSTG